MSASDVMRGWRLCLLRLRGSPGFDLSLGPGRLGRGGLGLGRGLGLGLRLGLGLGLRIHLRLSLRLRLRVRLRTPLLLRSSATVLAL